MNILVAGIHGVGKTYIASQAASLLAMTHTSASKLIKEERLLASWGQDKRVSDIDANQLALASAVQRHNEQGVRLLLDGHFVLKGEAGNFIPLEPQVFSSLGLDGVILIENKVDLILERLKDRDDHVHSYEETVKFMELERLHALKVCKTLNIPLTILMAPLLDEFVLQTISLGKPA